MNKIDMIKFLLQEVEEEQLLFYNYHVAEKVAKEKAKIDPSNSRYYYLKWEGRNPSKARIISNLLKIRQLTQDITKETNAIRGCY